MNIDIKSGKYEVWPGFMLVLESNITLAEGHYYQLLGPNGCGKSSFLKKLLLPGLLEKPEKHYVLYIEQQIQSQFDAIKADSLLNKRPLPVENYADMIDYLFECLQEEYKNNPKPVLVVSDECPHHYLMKHWLEKLTELQICVIFISHVPARTEQTLALNRIEFTPVTANQAKVNML